jgi:hypothetical protein
MDENLKVVSLEIFDVERAQGDLFADLPTHEAEPDDGI